MRFKDLPQLKQEKKFSETISFSFQMKNNICLVATRRKLPKVKK